MTFITLSLYKLAGIKKRLIVYQIKSYLKLLAKIYQCNQIFFFFFFFFFYHVNDDALVSEASFYEVKLPSGFKFSFSFS